MLGQESVRIPLRKHLVTLLRLSDERFIQQHEQYLKHLQLTDSEYKLSQQTITLNENPDFLTEDPDKVNQWLINMGAPFKFKSFVTSISDAISNVTATLNALLEKIKKQKSIFSAIHSLFDSDTITKKLDNITFAIIKLKSLFDGNQKLPSFYSLVSTADKQRIAQLLIEHGKQFITIQTKIYTLKNDGPFSTQLNKIQINFLSFIDSVSPSKDAKAIPPSITSTKKPN